MAKDVGGGTVKGHMIVRARPVRSSKTEHVGVDDCESPFGMSRVDD